LLLFSLLIEVEICTSAIPKILRGSQNFKNMKFIASGVSEIHIQGVTKFKDRSHDLWHAPSTGNCTICVKFSSFNILVKFCEDSFIAYIVTVEWIGTIQIGLSVGYQEIC